MTEATSMAVISNRCVEGRVMEIEPGGAGELRIVAGAATLYAPFVPNPQEDRPQRAVLTSNDPLSTRRARATARGAVFPTSWPAAPPLLHGLTTMTQIRDSSESPSQPSATDDAPLAAALARIPSGLFIVTWQDEGRARGMLASWVMQAGFAPPAITVAVGVDRDLVAAIERGCRFVVNILGESQRPLLARFGRPSSKGDDPFVGLDLSRSPGGGPVLVASVGWLECRAVGRVGGDITDHVVVLAEVAAAAAAGSEPPLVHMRKNGLRY